MSEITKPSGMNLIWASGGDKLNPGDSKYQSGWAVELPPRQWENFIQNKQDQALAHINQHGIVKWDSETEYQANKSYVQGATGTVYRCILTHTNQNPDTDVTNTYWIIAFASAGDFYTKTETDNLYLKIAQDGADISNTATFRNSISVYAKSETYTKTEVDAKTTVSSTAQAQALTSNTVLITALRLAEAFKGANQVLSAQGTQKIPGGLILKWGNLIRTGTDTLVTFPEAFPTALVFACPVGQAAASYTNDVSLGSTFAASGFNIRSGTRPDSFYWFAIGY